MPNTGTHPRRAQKDTLRIFWYSGPIEPPPELLSSQAVPQKSSPKRAATPQSSSPAKSRTKHIDRRARVNKKTFHRERNPADIPAHAWPRQDEQRCSQSSPPELLVLTHQFPKKSRKTRQKAMVHVRDIPQNSRRNHFGRRAASSPEKLRAKASATMHANPKKNEKTKKLFPEWENPSCCATPHTFPLSTLRGGRLKSRRPPRKRLLRLGRRRPRGALYIKHIPVFKQVAWFDLSENKKKKTA